jgi:hypothetical protein
MSVPVAQTGRVSEGLADQVDGRFRLSDVQGDHAQQVQGVGLVRIASQEFPIEGTGAIEPAGLVMADRLVEKSLDLFQGLAPLVQK